jgi:hypothetical protein
VFHGPRRSGRDAMEGSGPKRHLRTPKKRTVDLLQNRTNLFVDNINVPGLVSARTGTCQSLFLTA